MVFLSHFWDWKIKNYFSLIFNFGLKFYLKLLLHKLSFKGKHKFLNIIIMKKILKTLLKT